MDPKVNGQLQREWSWLIAIYLFLGGVGGGAYTIAAINGFLGESMQLSTTVGLWIGFPALLIGNHSKQDLNCMQDQYLCSLE